ncbi:AGCS family alanine or glycine:cation symporter [Brevibacterium sanguinis]|uniref:AGCS family alanine or glycine:cation symporter n=2 Tax=Brevibacterium TaxID=1696 RepID=A0A366IJM7_9MICO|nr:MULTISPECIES: alanine/glycine:cation symporter family protein [Brevibacterium]RBP65717.1 AGCS family alanine or glycine:cation symporter [Brevibacterium sanguinis]RBP72351.1 AGCS family alanine or glycine:cation symporter [Brevibacterium celere]
MSALVSQGVSAPQILAQEATGIDAALEEYFGPVARAVESVVFYPIPVFGTEMPIIVLWLVVLGLFFTLWLKFLNVRGMKHAYDLVRGRFTPPDAVGEVSHFQALSTALASTVGLGNIAGVAVAITIGGPGAAFWMIVAGFLAMSTKMAECMLAVKYRTVHPDGTTSGGPMYYLSRGLAEVGKPRLGRFLAAAWALFMMIAAIGTNAFQSNQAVAQVVEVSGSGAFGTWLGDNRWLLGLIIAVVTGLVILGGIQAIAKVAGVMVPAMAIIYILGCLMVLAVNVPAIPGAMVDIVTGAFNPEGVAGGVIGSLIVGFQRAAFSNSAGIGDAPIAHSTVKTNRPPTEGFVASLEPFVDTIIVCTMTALVVVVTGVWKGADPEVVNGVTLTSRSFATVADWFPYVLAVAVVLFAYSTLLSNSFYGMKCFGYLFGDRKTAETVYKVIYLCFTVIGAAVSLGPIIVFTDSVFFLPAVCNGIGLYVLAKVIRGDFRDYWQKLHAGDFERVK